MIIPAVWDKFKKVAWFLPGFCLYAAFPPMGEGMDVLFALAPLMWLARKGNVKESVKRWTQSGAFFWLATLSWMPAIVKNGGPWPLVLLGWFALAAYCTLYFAAFGYLSASYWKWAKNFRLAGILFVEPILWCGLELVRSNFGGGFAWNQLGVVPANFGFGAPAALGGVYLLSAVVVLINGSIAGIVERVTTCGTSSRWRSLETVVVFALVFGVYKVADVSTPRGACGGTEGIKVALMQRNFPCCFKAREESPLVVYSNLVAHVSALKPDIVVLPESAMSEFGAIDGGRAARFAALMREWTGAKAIVAGGSRMDEDRREYNSAAIFGDSFEVYDKVHLVPFGEYIPGDKLFPILQKLAPVGSCTPGKTTLLHLPPSPSPSPFGVAICYEDTDSALIRSFAKKGARFLCFITNDSWFSYSNETMQHAWQATARAIETGLPVVRVGNSGVTGTITSEGRWTRLDGEDGKPLIDEAGVMMDQIILSSPSPTLYVLLGDIPLATLFTLLILAMILVKYYPNYKLRGIPLNE